MTLTFPSTDNTIHKPTKKHQSINFRPNGLNKYQQNILSKSYGIIIIFISTCDFYKVHHIVGHKPNLCKFKTTIFFYVLSPHDGMKLELNSKRNYKNYTNTIKLNNTLCNQKWTTKNLEGVGGNLFYIK